LQINHSKESFTQDITSAKMSHYI